MKETNMEHFRGEIEDVLKEKKGGFAIRNGKIEACQGKPCKECEFRSLHCISDRMTWLMSEYKSEPVLTEKEMRFMEFVQRGWLARDADGDLFWHGGKPEKNFDSWHNFEMKYSKVNSYDGEIFHFITWEDEEPWSVEELRKLKVENA